MSCTYELNLGLQSAIQSQEASGDAVNEHIVTTKLRQKRRNRIHVYDDRLARVSDGSKSKPQTITKDDVIAVAKWAVESPDNQFSTKDPTLKPARMGSIVCTMLALLPDFDYLPGQVLVYRGR